MTLFDGATAVREIACAGPSAIYSAAEQVADFGVLPPSFSFAVTQLSAVLGAGHAARGEFHG